MASAPRDHVAGTAAASWLRLGLFAEHLAPSAYVAAESAISTAGRLSAPNPCSQPALAWLGPADVVLPERHCVQDKHTDMMTALEAALAAQSSKYSTVSQQLRMELKEALAKAHKVGVVACVLRVDMCPKLQHVCRLVFAVTPMGLCLVEPHLAAPVLWRQACALLCCTSCVASRA
jgi:hypothetical protein